MSLNEIRTELGSHIMFRPGVWFGIAGFVYGLILVWFGFRCAGAGHGTYLPIFIFAAPISLLGIAISFMLTPVMWLLIGILLGTTPQNGRKWPIAVVLAVHYAAAIYLVSSTASMELAYLQRTMTFSRTALFFAALTYTVGQLAIWIALAKRIANYSTHSSSIR